MLVHKSWKALFSSSEFVKSHLIQQQSYKEREHVIGKSGNRRRDGVCIISRSADAHAILGPSCFDRMIGSINGLVCMASSRNNFCIWNPAIGQIKIICRPPCHHCYNCFARRLMGFSWDHKRNDYKVVSVCSLKLFIYSSNSSRWTEVLISPDSVDIPEFYRYISGCYRQRAPCTIVKGILYWRCAEYENLSLQQLHVFKFVAENNEFRSLPDLYNSVVLQGKDFNIVNIRDRLSVLVYTTKQQYSLVDVYFLDEKSSDGVWSKMYSIGPIHLHNGYPFCFKNSGDILIDTSREVYIYDTKTKELKSVIDSRHPIRSICYCYTPSLVCVEGMQFDAHTFLEI